MNIMHVLDHSVPLHSGYAFRTLCILREQQKQGWETTHLTGPKHYLDSAPEESVDGFLFYRTPPLGNLVKRLPVYHQYAVIGALERRLLQVCRQTRPDILHAHSPALNGLAALRVSRRLGIPLVYEMRASWEDAAVDHGSTTQGSLRYRVSRALETRVLRQADAIVTISEGLRRDILARDIPAEKVTLVPNAVDLPAAELPPGQGESLRRKLGLEHAMVLGFIGSFYAYEGLNLLLDALPRLIEKHNDVRLLLVGGGPEESKLRKKVTGLGLEEIVCFTGRVSHEEVPAYYAAMDVCVFPRLSMRLTEIVTPLKPLEAMANRRALVASDVGGHLELIRDGETGVLFRSGNASAMVDAIADLLDKPQKRKSLEQKGREFIAAERNWARLVGRYAHIYRRLCPLAV